MKINLQAKFNRIKQQREITNNGNKTKKKIEIVRTKNVQKNFIPFLRKTNKKSVGETDGHNVNRRKSVY